MAIVAWTWLLYLDEVDTDLMDRFVNEHYGDAPEPGGVPARPPNSCVGRHRSGIIAAGA